ncbi:MAG: hypothetical protein KatS3mg087_2119 [Patescibacteria group bacterium]|nr:MAG: hypothetical protein KatS3mg087_2119 [Patescibacteria group bacterium]
MLEYRNWVYRAEMPTPEQFQLIQQQLFEANQLRNKYVELELQRREEIKNALLTLCPRLNEIEKRITDAHQHIENIEEQIRQYRIQHRKRTAPANLREELNKARAMLRSLYEQRKVIRSEEFDTEIVKQTIESIDRRYHELGKQAYRESNLYWGTKNVVLESTKTFKRGTPPKFRRFEGNGMLAVQIQTPKGRQPLTVERALEGKDTRLRLEVPEALQQELATKGRSRGIRSIATVWMRVGSTPKREPIWLPIRFRMHRPFPPGARIEWCYLHCEAKGLDKSVPNRSSDWDFRVRFVISVPKQERSIEDKKPLVALHLGWRYDRVNHTLRVGYWYDGQQSEPIILPARMLKYLEIFDKKASALSRLFNSFRDDFVRAWLELLHDGKVPQPLVEASQYIEQWKSARRFASLFYVWRDNRFDGDDALWLRYTNWRSQFRSYSAVKRAAAYKLRRCRNDLYRKIARRFEHEYQYVSIAEIDYAQLRERPDVIDEEDPNGELRRRRAQAAAPGTLRYYVREVMGPYCINVDPKNITASCHKCGAHNEWDHKILIHRCENCGEIWDQDYNAACNQYARAKAMLDSRQPLATQSQQEVTTLASGKPASHRQQRLRPARKANPNVGNVL